MFGKDIDSKLFGMCYKQLERINTNSKIFISAKNLLYLDEIDIVNHYMEKGALKEPFKSWFSNVDNYRMSKIILDRTEKDIYKWLGVEDDGYIPKNFVITDFCRGLVKLIVSKTITKIYIGADTTNPYLMKTLAEVFEEYASEIVVKPDDKETLKQYLLGDEVSTIIMDNPELIMELKDEINKKYLIIPYNGYNFKKVYFEDIGSDCQVTKAGLEELMNDESKMTFGFIDIFRYDERMFYEG